MLHNNAYIYFFQGLLFASEMDTNNWCINVQAVQIHLEVQQWAEQYSYFTMDGNK